MFGILIIMLRNTLCDAKILQPENIVKRSKFFCKVKFALVLYKENLESFYSTDNITFYFQRDASVCNKN